MQNAVLFNAPGHSTDRSERQRVAFNRLAPAEPPIRTAVGDSDSSPNNRRDNSEPIPKVLVVDDDPSIGDVLQQVLSRDGFVVQTVGGIDGALTALQAVTFDAVVLDIHLPDPSGRNRSGLEVLSFMRIHEHLKAVPVVILTDGSLAKEEEKAIWGLHAYVLKKSEGCTTVHQYLKYLTSATGHKANHIH